MRAWWVLVVALTAAPAAAQGWPLRDSAMGKAQQDMDRWMGLCGRGGRSNVERTECLDKFLQPLRDEVKSGLAAQYKSSEQWAKERSAYDAEGAAKGLRERKDDIRAAQAAWEAYTKHQCHAVVNRYEIEGGTGGAGDMVECQLRHLLFRKYELRL